MSCSERLSPCSCKYCAACLFSSGCFSACCRAAESLRKTGSPNPRWNAALDSVQLGWLMHQVPNTMALLWWGDVLCSPHFTGAFFSFFFLPSRSCIVQAGEKKLSWMFQVCSSSSVLLNVSVRSERQVVSAVTSWRAVVYAGSSPLTARWSLQVCFVSAETQPAAVFKGCCCVWLPGRISVKAFVWGWMGLRGEAQRLC